MMVLYSPDWTNTGFSFILLTVNPFRHSTLTEHGLYLDAYLFTFCMLFFSCVTFVDCFKNDLFQIFFSGLPSECQTVWVQITPD